MIDNSMDRIIGDYMEINSDIVAREFNSKLPKFISKWISRNQRKKLLSSVEKFRNSNYILTWFNLVELFTYIFNNFEPDHSYGIITKVEIINNKMEALVEYDDYHALVFFDNLPEEISNNQITFNLKIRKITADISDGIDIYLSKLKGSTKKTQDFVNDFNYVLKNCIADYLDETIGRYMEE